MRFRNKPWADIYLKEQEKYVELDPVANQGNWRAKFKEDQPLHLEIGPGKGQFIVGMAKQHPGINFIAVEVVKSVLVLTVEKIVEVGLDNVKVVNYDANHLKDLFAENELDRIYLNFSDPWPKNRHEKRRLTFKKFLEQYKTVLKPGGEIIFKTDNQALFEYSLMSFSQFGMIIDDVSLDVHALNEPTNVMTEYEERFSKKGHRIYRCQARFIE